MSAAAVEGNAVDPAAASGAAATVQARAVVIGAVTAILMQPMAVCVWLLAIYGWHLAESGDWGSLSAGLGALASGLAGLGVVSMAAVAVATPFVVVLGVPTFLCLNAARQATCLNLVAAGALAGAIPFALLSVGEWPVIALAGFHGAAGGLAFYSAWRRAGGLPRPRVTAD